MPDSDYNLDNRAYGAIWGYTKLYHTKLKARALEKAGFNQVRFDLAHVDQAQRELQQEIYHNIQRDIQQQQSVFSKIAKEFASITGGACAGALIVKIIEIATTQQSLNSISPIFWIAGLVGVGLIFYKIFA